MAIIIANEPWGIADSSEELNVGRASLEDKLTQAMARVTGSTNPDVVSEYQATLQDYRIYWNALAGADKLFKETTSSNIQTFR